MTKIVVLDGHSLNPGDLDWSVLAALGDLTVYDRTQAHDIISRSEGAQILLTNKTPLTAQTMDRLPQLNYIGVLATGYNVVDVAAATSRQITVTNIPAYSTYSVAQLVFALVLEWCHRVQWHSDAVMAGDWTQSLDFCFWKSPLMELQGKTMGIIGFGQIGRQVAAIAQALGMSVAVNSRTRPHPDQASTVSWMDLDALFAASDVLSIHCPLTPQTQGLVNKERLAHMKPSAFLVNTSRGGVVVEQDLADALNQGRLAGAGLDVLSTEPPAADNPLLGARNCLITPHIAWATLEARQRLMALAVSNVAAFLQGQPQNVVS